LSSASTRISSSDGDTLIASVSRNVARPTTSSSGIRKAAAVAPETVVMPDTPATSVDGLGPAWTRSAAMPV
jgi:hypothetical protein